MSIGVSSSLSAYDQMQAWSAKRSTSYDTFQSQNSTLVASLGGSASSADTLSAMLTGGSSSSSSTFISNEALSSSLYGNVADNLTSEENLVAQIVYKRVMQEQSAKAAQQQSQIDGLMSSLKALA
ncbi:hypothetical protein [Labrys wisconsinensis]|uniref:Uncharacterized protein n=1 Tax=Labrys wisconsinensis TaxID=425677 RepID=A0ABU0JCK9_9HYPH|nr:hypothetical protein [Labrys wisconsinensis]MDQ0470999.1 hypothetical protein [Labrys wisconsinensis]